MNSNGHATRTSHLSDHDIQALLDDEVEGRGEAASHLTHCPDCRAKVSAWEDLFSELNALPALPPSRGFAALVMARCAVPQRRWGWLEAVISWTTNLGTEIDRRLPRTAHGWALVSLASVPMTVGLLLFGWVLSSGLSGLDPQEIYAATILWLSGWSELVPVSLPGAGVSWGMGFGALGAAWILTAGAAWILVRHIILVPDQRLQ